MKVAKHRVVSLIYQVRTEENRLLEEYDLDSPLQYLHGQDTFIPALEKTLEGREVGERFELHLDADDAYGCRDENLVQRVEKALFVDDDDPTLEVGMCFLVDTDQGQMPVTITAIEDQHVVIDGSHLLSGQNLHFNIEIVAIRQATEQELQHGEVYCGHHHHHYQQTDNCCAH